jgi:hypothetical protein
MADIPRRREPASAEARGRRGPDRRTARRVHAARAHWNKSKPGSFFCEPQSLLWTDDGERRTFRFERLFSLFPGLRLFAYALKRSADDGRGFEKIVSRDDRYRPAAKA